MEKKKKRSIFGRLGCRGRGVSISQLLTSRQITRDEAIAMVGKEIVEKFEQELKTASGRLRKVGEYEYLARAGKVLVNVEMTNSFVYRDTYELSESGLRYLKVRVAYAADDVHHDGNDEFGL